MDKQTSSRITILGFVMTSVIVMYHCGATGVVPLNILDEKMSGEFFPVNSGRQQEAGYLILNFV